MAFQQRENVLQTLSSHQVGPHSKSHQPAGGLLRQHDPAKSQGMKQLMAGGGVALIGTTLRCQAGFMAFLLNSAAAPSYTWVLSLLMEIGDRIILPISGIWGHSISPYAGRFYGIFQQAASSVPGSRHLGRSNLWKAGNDNPYASQGMAADGWRRLWCRCFRTVRIAKAVGADIPAGGESRLLHSRRQTISAAGWFSAPLAGATCWMI